MAGNEHLLVIPSCSYAQLFCLSHTSIVNNILIYKLTLFHFNAVSTLHHFPSRYFTLIWFVSQRCVQKLSCEGWHLYEWNDEDNSDRTNICAKLLICLAMKKPVDPQNWAFTTLTLAGRERNIMDMSALFCLQKEGTLDLKGCLQ